MLADQGSKAEKSSGDRTVNPDAPQQGIGISGPSIALPKGGGAIRGIGEKFAANPVTGSGSMTVPIATSPGRGGFGPQLALAYDSGAGNGPFGLGWNLSLPAITRKTDKGLPQYRDAAESDVFILSGAEDLVPVYRQDQHGDFVRDSNGNLVIHEDPRDGYTVRRYRPRIEGLFARIERWTNQTDATDTFWRSISKENVTTWYGKSAESRITDPADPTHIFSWLICESYDDKGNVIRYLYKAENSQGITLSQPQERNRTADTRAANRYLKRILYGNRTPRQPAEELSRRSDWLFEVVFDYGEHYSEDSQGQPTGVFLDDDHQPWPVRQDPFSTYRAGFEVRTYRLCRRVLMFHHFAAELGTADYLTRSTEFAYTTSPIASFISAVTQSGFLRQTDGVYRKKSLPPVEFSYSPATIQENLREVATASLANLPAGLDGSAYQWVDLDGEGLSGILTEQANGWFYKRNLSPINIVADNGSTRVAAHFAPVELVATRPASGLAGGRAQFLDLAGDGQIDLVTFREPTPGFYERTADAQSWEPFTPFAALPILDWDDPNLKFIDLTGDGHADILISHDDLFFWHPSLAEAGFGPQAIARQSRDEETGPRLVFTDATQSIYLADMGGDGLTDLVRLRNGEVCYWPNLGYGRFGAKVSMDAAPWFDHPDQFDQKRIRLADIDGSGTTDIIYLHGDGVCLYFNRSGNSWSAAHRLRHFPPIDNLSAVMTVDLLGNGTACLVWSSPLPGDSPRPLRYIQLMAEKPHLLISVKNNLGAETHIRYAPSTKFYLADQVAGKPWITKLPFPVHCVESVTVTDQWRKTTFATTYSYHHGYFDGREREFRGFGRVEQIDVESFGQFAAGNSASPYITNDQTLYQPPVKTVTWFHTGAFLNRARILSQFADEYFAPAADGFQEDALPEPDLITQGLSADEWHEALRACKGMMLRQEVYELEVDALHERHEQRPVKLFSTVYHNCQIQCVQPRATNRHAVFLVTESEAITYTYELDLRSPMPAPDPRIAHNLNLRTDQYGNVLQAVAVVYPRLGQYADADLRPDDVTLINRVQQEMHLAYTETRYTDNDVIEADAYRLRLPCEVLTYELTGILPTDARYFTIDELRGFALSPEYQPITEAEEELQPVVDIAYHRLPNRTSPQKRPVEHVRMLYFDANLQTPLPFKELNALGLPYETYKLALTDDLLTAILGDKLDDLLTTGEDRQAMLDRVLGEGGYHRFPAEPNRWWVRSGIAGFALEAANHFYLPERYIDPFSQTTTLQYDEGYYLYLHSSRDPVGNRTEVTRFDFRVLAPAEMRDPNNNLSEVAFDILGMPAAVAVKGKGSEGDNLETMAVDLDTATLIRFFTGDYDEAAARALLGSATARHLYYFGEQEEAGHITYGHYPACAAGLVREVHLAQGGETSPLQASLEYADGMGQVLMAKAKAEGGLVQVCEDEVWVERSLPLRWITNGKTILNNKGKPVKQYEPYFSPYSHWNGEEACQEIGVTPVMYYDAAGRLVRTEAPDGSYSRVEFSPWFMAVYDANDTVVERGNAWHARYATGTPQEQHAAHLATFHADTPAVTHLDSLGREVVAVAHNRTPANTTELANTPLLDRPWIDEKYVTYTKLDAEGKPLWIRNDRGNLVMQYVAHPPTEPPEPISNSAEPERYTPAYDIAGNLLFQHSMDGGDRWMLMDSTGQPCYAWDENERVTEAGALVPERRLYHTTYDDLRRPQEQRLRINVEPEQVIEHFVYGEGQPDDQARNLRGQVYQHNDASGRITNERFDFKSNLLMVTRQLVNNHRSPMIDWSGGLPAGGLGETFTQRTEYDALNRMTRLENWHLAERQPAIYVPEYNERGLLRSETLTVRESPTAAIRMIAYDAKGQRTHIEYDNNTATRYDYDPLTFRLTWLTTTRTGGDGLFQDLHYTYDPVGNITHIRDEAQQTIFFRNRRVEPSTSYTYDALYRLIEASGREHLGLTSDGRNNPPTAPDQFNQFHSNHLHPHDGNAMGAYVERYIYDAVGNIDALEHQGSDPAHPGWTRHYEYAPDSNRLLRTWIGGDEGNAVRYEYDTHGSMLNIANVAPGQSLRWDHRDMIHTLDLEGGGWAYYSYDSGKQRTRKRIERNGSTVEERFYLGGMEWYRRWRNDNLEEEIETHHLFVDDQRVLLVEDVIETDSDLPRGVLHRYQYGNHLGSVGLELDATGQIISYEEYHPYGTTAYQANNAAVRAKAKRYRYTGMERDEESGLSYHTARYYLPWLGRWGSVDPIGLEAGCNLYAFCSKNPVILIDPTGNQPREQVPPITHRQRVSAGFAAAQEQLGWWNPLYLGIVVLGAPAAYIAADAGDFIAERRRVRGGQTDPVGGIIVGVTIPVRIVTERLQFASRTARATRRALAILDDVTEIGIPGATHLVPPNGEESPEGLPEEDVHSPADTETADTVPADTETADTVPADIEAVDPTPLETPAGLGELIDVNTTDPAAVALAARIGGRPSVRFVDDIREFDAVSDQYVAQSKPANFRVGQRFRMQARATFEMALATQRTPYFHFEGPPGRDALRALERYEREYGITPVIDTRPLR